MTRLETVEGDSRETVTFETDELTALCPFDFGGPDFYDLTIRYQSETGVESRSLKRYLESFRDIEATVEDLAATIYDDIAAAIAPDELYVRLEQARRGGIEETVEVGTLALR
jgi:7-cyano-7-deazaguanine reductase